MLIVPASKVSVLVDVIRTAVSTAASETSPPPKSVVDPDCLPVWLDTQALPVMLTIVIMIEAACAAVSDLTIKPAVELVVAIVEEPADPAETYPVIVYVGVAPVPN